MLVASELKSYFSVCPTDTVSIVGHSPEFELFLNIELVSFVLIEANVNGFIRFCKDISL